MEPLLDDHTMPRRRDGQPLRRSEEVIHLGLDDMSMGDERDYIHEAQVSVMVTGVDDWFWTAYCFVDIYFKEDEHSEKVTTLSSPVNPMDPNSCGKYALDRPTWNPRHYFLSILSCRMEQAKQEWSNTVFQLFSDIEPCVWAPVREVVRC